MTSASLSSDSRSDELERRLPVLRSIRMSSVAFLEAIPCSRLVELRRAHLQVRHDPVDLPDVQRVEDGAHPENVDCTSVTRSATGASHSARRGWPRGRGRCPRCAPGSASSSAVRPPPPSRVDVDAPGAGERARDLVRITVRPGAHVAHLIEVVAPHSTRSTSPAASDPGSASWRRSWPSARARREAMSRFSSSAWRVCQAVPEPAALRRRPRGRRPSSAPRTAERHGHEDAAHVVELASTAPDT